MATEKAKEVVQKVQLTVSGVLKDLAEGLDRIAIREKYSLSATDVKRLFENEKLKGARVRKAPAFELIDDTAEEEVVKASTKKETPKAKEAPIAKEKATVAAQVDEGKAEEEEEQQEVATQLTEETGSKIKEVAEADEVEVDTKKGLW